MERFQDPEKIKEVAKELDDSMERKDVEKVLTFFSDQCSIDMLDMTLTGKEGVRRWLEWLFSTIDEINFEPVTIMVDGNIFFEEFILKGTLKNGVKVESKQSEVLEYRDYKVENLRLYFDRLDFAEVIGDGPIKRKLIKMVRNTSLKKLKE